jgi:hypothetical protein
MASNKRKSVQGSLRRRVLERDDFKCLKCGRMRNLEIHHIMPVVYGGIDIFHNLITLCSGCHRFAPNDPVEFFKWACKSIPHEMEQSKVITKVICQIVEKNAIKGPEAIEGFIDSIYSDLWKVYVSNDINELAKFFNNYFEDKDKHIINTLQGEVGRLV